MYQIDVSDNEMRSGHDAIPFGCEEFLEAQRGDKSLEVYFTRAAAGSEEFKVIRGLLYRKQGDRINSLEQCALAVPLKYRKQLLFLAHDHPCSAHLGVNKTLKRLQAYYFWPKLKQSVAQYVKCC